MIPTVSGVGSQWANSADLYVGGDASGPAGNGTLIVKNGGHVGVTNLLKVYSTGAVSLAGGLINASTLDLEGGSLSGWGVVNGEITGGSTITATGGPLLLGNVESTQGYDFNGSIDVQDSASLLIFDLDEAQLGTQTTLTNGLLVARGSVELDSTDVISGYGIIIGSITGSGSVDIATNPSGTVRFAGELGIKSDTAKIHSVGFAELSGAVTN
jgi:T5SS/PEP-CTERM-associated repeat protein